tara:strand:- start:1134 stop:1640 length:507 start_codon:yes stop_codon:yes gene_type:complete
MRRRAKTNYSTPDSPAWRDKCDDLFLSQYRGKPCEYCGKTEGYENGQKQSSCGHHLIFKGRCREHRYNPRNIVVLCPVHHSHWSEFSPHSMTNTLAQAQFAAWLEAEKPEQFKWWTMHQDDQNKPFSKSWTYRDMYERLGGKIKKEGPMKDWKPINHAAAVRRIKGQE